MPKSEKIEDTMKSGADEETRVCCWYTTSSVKLQTGQGTQEARKNGKILRKIGKKFWKKDC